MSKSSRTRQTKTLQDLAAVDFALQSQHANLVRRSVRIDFLLDRINHPNEPNAYSEAS